MNNSIVTMKSLFMVILLIAISQVMMAQNKTIIGTIVDSETKESVSGAVIAIGDYKVYSDMDGRFSLPAEGNNNEITVTYIGYKPITINVFKEHNLGIVEMKMDTRVLPDAIIFPIGCSKKDSCCCQQRPRLTD